MNFLNPSRLPNRLSKTTLMLIAFMLPPRARFLCANIIGYSLAAYPAGSGTTATPDVSFTNNINDNAGVALFSTSNP